jgi:hypothetical protein
MIFSKVILSNISATIRNNLKDYQIDLVKNFSFGKKKFPSILNFKYSDWFFCLSKIKKMLKYSQMVHAFPTEKSRQKLASVCFGVSIIHCKISFFFENFFEFLQIILFLLETLAENLRAYKQTIGPRLLLKKFSY